MMSDLQKSRENAERSFRALPSPASNEEAYRFGGMTDWEASLSAASTTSAAPSVELEEGSLLVLFNGEAKLLGEQDGFILRSLAKADSFSEQAFPQDKFAQLAAARWQNGAELKIAAGKKVAAPIRIFCQSSGNESHWRHHISLGEGAEATLVIELAGDDSSRLSAELLELELAAGAKLHWSILQRNGKGTTAFHRHKVKLGKSSELKLCSVQLGGAKSQLRMDFDLAEKANLEAQGACRGDGAQHFDFWVDVVHSGPRSISTMNFWYVMAEKARSVFNGLVQVKKGANDCEATQKAKSLLLGNGATVHAIPKLIIQTDAVKCGHGASVSSVNPEQLHYLQSRGIPREEAERMIVRGFTEPVLAQLPTPALYQRAEALLELKKGEES